MRKLICILAALLLLCLCATAYAADPLTVSISALDYQTGRAVSKTYVENEMFRLRVDIGIPRFFDLTDMELKIELDGVELTEHDVTLADGTYYIEGIVTEQPAALRVVVKDRAYDKAQTAEELYNAMQEDRTVSATYYFNAAQTVEKISPVIPKTGDASIVAPVLACVGVLLIAIPRRRR